MGVKAGLSAAVDLGMAILIGTVAVWVICLQLNQDYSSTLVQDDLILIAIIIISTLITQMLLCFMPNLTAVWNFKKLLAPSIILTFAVFAVLVAGPVTLLSFYTRQGRNLQLSQSPLFAPMIVWTVLMFVLALWQTVVVFVNLFFRSHQMKEKGGWMF